MNLRNVIKISPQVPVQYQDEEVLELLDIKRKLEGGMR